MPTRPDWNYSGTSWYYPALMAVTIFRLARTGYQVGFSPGFTNKSYR